MNTSLLGAIESNSSKNNTQGFAALARSNKSRTWYDKRCQVNTIRKVGVTHRFLTSTDIFIQNFWTFYTYEIQATLLSHGGCQKCLSTSWITIQQQAIAYRVSIWKQKDARRTPNVISAVTVRKLAHTWSATPMSPSTLVSSRRDHRHLTMQHPMSLTWRPLMTKVQSQLGQQWNPQRSVSAQERVS